MKDKPPNILREFDTCYINNENRYKHLYSLLLKDYPSDFDPHQFIRKIDRDKGTLLFTKYMIILKNSISNREKCLEILGGIHVFFSIPDKESYMDHFMTGFLL